MRSCEHEIKARVHVGHFHGGPIKKYCSADCLVRIWSHPCIPHLRSFEIIENRLKLTAKRFLNSNSSTNWTMTYVCLKYANAEIHKLRRISKRAIDVYNLRLTKKKVYEKHMNFELNWNLMTWKISAQIFTRKQKIASHLPYTKAWFLRFFHRKTKFHHQWSAFSISKKKQFELKRKKKKGN